MTRYLGIDGGGTKTEFVCIDGAGDVVARAVTGTTYHLEVGVDEAVRRLETGIGAICGDLGLGAGDVDYVFVGLPAYGENRTVDPLLEAACGQILGHRRYACGNDMICGWAGSLGGEDGINIVAGTGSIGYGENGTRAARIGGWGEVFGDEGSAYWIGVRGLTLFTRMSDGRAARGPLYDRVRKSFDLDDDLDLLACMLGSGGRTRSEYAALASLVSDAARDGDAGAHAILVAAGDELALMALTLRGMLGFPVRTAVPVSWSGGVLSNEPVVRTAFINGLMRAEPFVAVPPRQSPAIGAALYARRLAVAHREAAIGA